MTATDHLGVQFRPETSKSDRKSERKAAEMDAKGADEQEAFGFSAIDISDNQWNRNKHSDKREVF